MTGNTVLTTQQLKALIRKLEAKKPEPQSLQWSHLKSLKMMLKLGSKEAKPGQYTGAYEVLDALEADRKAGTQVKKP